MHNSRSVNGKKQSGKGKMEIAQGAIKPCRRHEDPAITATGYEAQTPWRQGKSSTAQLSADRKAHKGLGEEEKALAGTAAPERPAVAARWGQEEAFKLTG
jgi:hypothetical protein